MRHKKNLWPTLEKTIGQVPDFHIAALIESQQKFLSLAENLRAEQRRESTGQALGGKGELKHVPESCAP